MSSKSGNNLAIKAKIAAALVALELAIAKTAESTKGLINSEKAAWIAKVLPGADLVASLICLINAADIHSRIEKLVQEEPVLRERAQFASERFQRLDEQLKRLLTNPTEEDIALLLYGSIQRDFDDACELLSTFTLCASHLLDKFESTKWWSEAVGIVSVLTAVGGGVLAVTRTGAMRAMGVGAGFCGAGGCIVSFRNVKRAREQISSLKYLRDTTEQCQVSKEKIDEVMNAFGRQNQEQEQEQERHQEQEQQEQNLEQKQEQQEQYQEQEQREQYQKQENPEEEKRDVRELDHSPPEIQFPDYEEVSSELISAIADNEHDKPESTESSDDNWVNI